MNQGGDLNFWTALNRHRRVTIETYTIILIGSSHHTPDSSNIRQSGKDFSDLSLKNRENLFFDRLNGFFLRDSAKKYQERHDYIIETCFCTI
jgi:hypothetical protein